MAGSQREFHCPYSIVKEPVLSRTGATYRVEAQGSGLPAGTHNLALRTGGADRDRTDDLLVANQALSQLSYSPACLDMVGLGRFELPTSRLSGVRSNQLSYRPSIRPSSRCSRTLPNSGKAESRPPGRASGLSGESRSAAPSRDENPRPDASNDQARPRRGTLGASRGPSKLNSTRMRNEPSG
jgi:hypothetical protein